MNNKRRIAVTAAAIAAAGLIAGRDRLRLIEDLRWADVAKPGVIIDIDGYGVHYVEAGRGPVVVLIHGFGGQTYSYRGLIPLLARDHRVIAVDLKGYGYSERSTSTGLSATDQVAMLHALLGRLGVGRAVFVGHSMGGGIVQRFASLYPEMVDAAVLVASVHADRQRRMRMTLPAPLFRPLLPYLGKLATTRLLKLSYHDQSVLTDDVGDEYRRPGRMQGSMDGLFKMMQSYKHDRPVDFARITMPVLLLNGAHDRIVRGEAAKNLQERIPHAQLVVIEGAGHQVLEERPADCDRAIRAFLGADRVVSDFAATAP